MKVLASKFSFTIADKAINNLAENPFKFPKPTSMKPRVSTGDGRVKPNISFSYMMEFVYTECMRHLLRKFKQNMLDTFDKMGDSGSIQNFKCGNTTFKRSIYMYPWDIQCSLVSLNGNLTVTDIDVLLLEMHNGAFIDMSRDFALEVLNAELKYRVKNEPLQVKGNDLHTQRTK
jgi:hypothetical protein